MRTIAIDAEESLLSELSRIAETRRMTVEQAAREALLQYIENQPERSGTYSFIGIGRSGKGDLSRRAEDILEETANRLEHPERSEGLKGWSLE